MILIRDVQLFIEECRRSVWISITGKLSSMITSHYVDKDMTLLRKALETEWDELDESDKIITHEDVKELLSQYVVPVENTETDEVGMAFIGKDEEDEIGAEKCFYEFMKSLDSRFMSNSLKKLVDDGLLDMKFMNNDFVFDLTTKGHEVVKELELGE